MDDWKDYTAADDTTCQWLFRQEEYQAWKRDGGIILVEGRAGAGKTTLTRHALMVDGAPGESQSIIFSFFFRMLPGSFLQTERGLVQSLLFQVLEADTKICDRFLEETGFSRRHAKESSAFQWSLTELWSQLEKTLSTIAQDRSVCIYIDALDEADKSFREQARKRLGVLGLISPNLRVYVSSRPATIYLPQSIRLEMTRLNGEDIETFVSKKLEDFESLDEGKRSMLAQRIVSKADGIFKWAALLMARLQELQDQMQGLADVAMLEAAIAEAPPGLDAFYADMIGRISQHDVPQALTVFRWLSFATEQLSYNQMKFAFRLEHDNLADWSYPDKDNAKPRWPRLNTTKVRDACDFHDDRIFNARIRGLTRGMARVVERRDHLSLSYVLDVEFDHQSQLAYMRKHGLYLLHQMAEESIPETTLPAVSHYRLTESCVKMLVIMTALVQQEKTLAEEESVMSTLQYAVHHWHIHAVKAEKLGSSLHEMLELTQWPSNEVWITWYNIHHRLSIRLGHKTPCKRIGLAHVAAMFGLASVIDELLRRRYETRIKRDDHNALTTGSGDKGYCPIHHAVNGRHMKVVERLLQADKDNVQATLRSSVDLLSPMHIAASIGDMDIVNILLSSGAMLNCKDKLGRLPVHHAAIHGHLVYLESVAGINSAAFGVKDLRGDTPLHLAAQLGHCDVIELLLKYKQVDPSQENNKKQTPLHVAWTAKATKFLLAREEVTPGKLDSAGDNALLLAASMEKNVDMVRLLLEADPSSAFVTNREGQTLLYCAAMSKDAEVWQLVCAAVGDRIDVNARTRNGDTALCCMVRDDFYAGHIEQPMLDLIKLLLAHPSIDVNAGGPDGKTPFYYAAKHPIVWSKPVLKLLLPRMIAEGKYIKKELRTYVDSDYDKKVITPLWAAVHDHDYKFVSLLIDAGSNVLVEDEGMTLLEYAEQCVQRCMQVTANDDWVEKMYSPNGCFEDWPHLVLAIVKEAVEMATLETQCENEEDQ